MWAAAEQRAGQTLDGRMDTYVRTQASCQQLQRNVVMLNTKSCTKKTHVDIITAQRSAHFTYADEDVGLHPDLHSFSFLSSLGFIISLFCPPGCLQFDLFVDSALRKEDKHIFILAATSTEWL